MSSTRESLPLDIYKKNIDPGRVVVVKDFPPGLDAGRLENHLKNDLELNVERIYFHEDNKDVALVVSKDKIDLRDIPSNAAEADTLGSPEGIVVDLPEGADVTMVQAYFDGEESGVGGQYTGLEMLSGKLIIKTENTDAVLSKALNKTHKLRHTEFFVEPYYPHFHDPALRQSPSGASASNRRHLVGCFFEECLTSVPAQCPPGPVN